MKMLTSTTTLQNSNALEVFFVTPEGSGPNFSSESMKLTFAHCKEQNLKASWITEDFDLSKAADKPCVFVLETFHGKFFNKLAEIKNKYVRVVGPNCLQTCLLENIPIPENNSPVYTMAMHGLHVTVSQFSESKKKELRNLIRYMGGFYSNHLHNKCSHVVTNSVRSPKYSKAVEMGADVMVEEWIRAVWELSLKENILATDEQFLKYRCPIFHGLEIAISNLRRSEKIELSKLVTEHGGTYNTQLSQKTASLLVVGKPEGEKFKHALSWDLPCVNPKWIHDSIQKKHAVSTSEYLMKPQVSCSTPTKDKPTGFHRNNDPSISGIGFTENQVTVCQVNETELSRKNDESRVTSETVKTPVKVRTDHNAEASVKTPVKTPVKNSYNYKAVLSQLNLQEAKRAGAFLDGCKVFLSGFNSMEEDILRRVLNAGGATRYMELSDTVTHVVVGEFTADIAKSIVSLRTKPHIVTLEWVLNSIRQETPANEEQYLCSKINHVQTPLEPASPLSRKGLSMLLPEFKKPTPSAEAPSSPISKQILKDYSNCNQLESNKEPMRLQKTTSAGPPDPLTIPETQDSQSSIANLFDGCTFTFFNLDRILEEEVQNIIISAGGKVVSSRFGGIPDYTVAPILTTELPNSSCEFVTHLWLRDCVEKCKVLEIDYFHQPQLVKSMWKPLDGCVLTSSNYIGQIRNFIKELGEGIGAVVQEVFAKKNKGEAAASTHLICPTPDGKKYLASLKWKLPAVKIDWIIACAQTGEKLPVGSYLVNPSCEVNDAVISKIDRTESNVGSTSSVNNKQFLQFQSTVQNSTSNGPFSTKLTNHHDADLQNPSQFNIPLANSTVCSSRNKRKSDSPLENTKDCEDSQDQTLRTSAPGTQRRWKKSMTHLPEEFNENKSQEHNQPMPAKRQKMPISELRKKMSSKPDDTLLSLNNVDDSNKTVNSSENPPVRANDSVTNSAAAIFQALQDIKDMPEFDGSRESSSRSNPRRRAEVVIRKPPEDSQLSQQPSIEWNDPVMMQQNEREKAQKYQDDMFPPSPSVPEPPKESEIVREKPRKFILSSIVSAEKKIYENIITTLGGTVLTDNLFSEETTHLVMEAPLRSEKLLCSLARGLWILHTSYLQLSMQQNSFLPEEEFEWGNPSSIENLPTLNARSTANLLAMAAHRWRKEISRTKKFAFSDVRALTYTSGMKTEPLNRLIKFGGGKVLTEAEISEVTHCFVDNPATVSLNWAKYAEHGIFCLHTIYLSDYLTSDPPPNPVDNLISEYVPYYNQYNGLSP